MCHAFEHVDSEKRRDIGGGAQRAHCLVRWLIKASRGGRVDRWSMDHAGRGGGLVCMGGGNRRSSIQISSPRVVAIVAIVIAHVHLRDVYSFQDDDVIHLFVWAFVLSIDRSRRSASIDNADATPIAFLQTYNEEVFR